MSSMASFRWRLFLRTQHYILWSGSQSLWWRINRASPPFPPPSGNIMNAENHPVFSKHINHLCLFRATTVLGRTPSYHSQLQSNKTFALPQYFYTGDTWRCLSWRRTRQDSSVPRAFLYYGELRVITKSHSTQSTWKVFSLHNESLTHQPSLIVGSIH